MRQSEALTFVGTRLAFHSFNVDTFPPRPVPYDPAYEEFIKTSRRLNREACEVLGKECLKAYDETVHILTQGKGF